MGVQNTFKQSVGLIKLPTKDFGLPQNLGLSRGKYLRYPVLELERIGTAARASLQQEGQINLLYFWGVGKKTLPDQFDTNCMKMLESIRNQIELTFQLPVALTLLLSDLHGLANQFSEEHISLYYSEVKKMAEDHQFKTILLSSLFSENDLLSLFESPTPAEFEIFNLHYQQLEIGASKTGTLDTVALRAFRYLLVRLRERSNIQKVFPNHILLNGDRRANEFFQVDLPMIYIYNTGFKKSHKAWFLTENKN